MALSDATIAKKLSDALRKDSYEVVADHYAVNKADIWRAVRKNYVSPALRRAVDPPRKRTRIIKETTPAIKEWWDRHITSEQVFHDMLVTFCDYARLPYPEDLP